MPACYIPGVVIVVAVFGVAALLAELLKAVTHAFDSVLAGLQQAVGMGAVAAKLTLLAIALTLAVNFVAWSARVVRGYQARRLAATGQPCPQVATCPIDCAVKEAVSEAASRLEPGGRRLLPVTAVERPSAGEFTPAA